MTSKEWKETKLAALCEIKGGKRLPKGTNLVQHKTKHPYIRVRDLNNIKNLELNCNFEYIENEVYNKISNYIVNSGDIIISIVGTIGLVSIITESLNQANLTENCAKLINLKDIDNNFLYYFLSSELGQNEIKKGTVGAVQQKLPLYSIGEINISLPPLETQEKIARILSSLDDKIELNNKINQNLEQQAQAIYNQLILTQELKEKTLSEIIEITDGTHDSPKVKEEGYYLITSKHLSKYGVNKDNANYISEEDFNKINERSKVDKYDILMSMIGTVGLVSLIIEEDIDFAVKNVGIFKTSLQKNYIYFIFSYLLSSSTQNYVKSHLAGTTQKYISLGELRNLKIKIPNEKILASFNNLVHPIYQKIIYNTNEIKILTQLRDTLLPKLMSGEIDVDKVNI